MYTGGLGELKIVDKENKINDIVKNIKNQFEKLIDSKVDILKAISYRTQVVSGTNYFIKVLVNENKYVHVKVYEPLPYKEENPQLISYQTDKTEDDEIKYI